MKKACVLSLWLTLLIAFMGKANAHSMWPTLLSVREVSKGTYLLSLHTKKTTVDATPLEKDDEGRILAWFHFSEKCSLIGDPDVRSSEADVQIEGSLSCLSPYVWSVSLTKEAPPLLEVHVIFRSQQGAVHQSVLQQKTPNFTPSDTRASPNNTAIKRYILLGIVHVLSGLDHLAFVALLVLIARQRKPILLSLTGFTFGHSITLAYASYYRSPCSSSLIEFLIALSVLIMAREAARSSLVTDSTFSARPRVWISSALFGLIHGFGFASALDEVGFPEQKAFALVAFNLGVELGQLIFVTALFVMSLVFRTQRRFMPSHKHREQLCTIAIYGMGSMAAGFTLLRAADMLRYWRFIS